MLEVCENVFEWSLTCEMSNMSTMILELIIAFGIAGMLSYYFYKRQKKDTEKISKISDEQIRLAKEQEELKKKREEYTTYSIKRELRDVRDWIIPIEKIREEYKDEPAFGGNDMYIKHIQDRGAEMFDKISTMVDLGQDILKEEDCNRIWDICSLGTSYCLSGDISDGGMPPKSKVFDEIENILEKLPKIKAYEEQVQLDEETIKIKTMEISKGGLFMKTIKQLEGNKKVPVKEDELVQELEKTGKFTGKKAKQYIKRFLREASIYESKPGYYNAV